MRLVVRSAPDAPPGGADRIDPLGPALARAVAGEKPQIERVLRAVAPAVVSLTRVILGPAHRDVEDVAQDSLTEIYRAIRRFRGDSTFLHYARRIAVRTALAARRRSRMTLPLPEGPDEIPSMDSPAFDRLASEQRWAALRVLLDELPEAQAETLAMRVVLGYPLSQVANETGVPVNTVRSRIRLAKDHIRVRIAANARLAALFEEEP